MSPAESLVMAAVPMLVGGGFIVLGAFRRRLGDNSDGWRWGKGMDAARVSRVGAFFVGVCFLLMGIAMTDGYRHWLSPALSHDLMSQAFPA